ncbi:hypothetical protein CCACVL1_27067 [Corchorus capsularis]|uniref:C2H2-type domain-containing protein n=1 Tax=Corchorus capsularis TaxID=210143 RepID=A0A1R3GC88_COCAP|nr:hypothetical protein CCACVL1_27067 [Corchorus capsularis]
MTNSDLQEEEPSDTHDVPAGSQDTTPADQNCNEFEGDPIPNHDQTRQQGDGGDKQKNGGESGDDQIPEMGSSASMNSYRSKKRARDHVENPIDDDSASASASASSSWKARKKGGEVQLPSSPPVPTCYVCKKTFASWKGVFGHLRAHPSRLTPGAFPPPTFTPPDHGSPPSPQKDPIHNGSDDDIEAFKEQLAPTLLNLARQITNIENISNTAPPLPLTSVLASSSSSSSRRGLDIDLNHPTISVLLDSNYEPHPVPPESDKEDHDHYKDLQDDNR